jgi:uncharacterized protein (TIGR02569 family)
VTGPPAAEVIAAFGGIGEPVALPGGRGSSWRAGGIVLKPADASDEELRWLADELPQALVRVSRPLAAADGRPTVDGWMAVPYLHGAHRSGAWLDIVATGDALHAALREHQRPAFLDRRESRWAVADRAAWDDVPTVTTRPVPLLDRLRRLSRPVTLPHQLVHGDLTGNVLFAADAPPAVIDISLYWRPGDYAAAVVVADALLWEGAHLADLEPVLGRPGIGQLLVRALRFRLLADLLGHEDHVEAPYEEAVDIAAALA